LREPLAQALDRLELAQLRRYLLLCEKHAALVAIARARELREEHRLQPGVLMRPLQIVRRHGLAALRESEQSGPCRLEPLYTGSAVRLAPGETLLRLREVAARLLQEDTAMALECPQREGVTP
jgi:hypothetical protein